jgi:hypothetical protein
MKRFAVVGAAVAAAVAVAGAQGAAPNYVNPYQADTPFNVESADPYQAEQLAMAGQPNPLP